MIAASLTFLTPRAGLLALAAVVPLAALALASRRERRARDILALAAPRGVRGSKRALAIVAVVGLLALAASQPVLRSTTSLRVRTDAEAFYVIDISRSMLASRSPDAATRIARARAAALRLRGRLIDVPSGVASMNDHVLPDLMPVAERSVFEQTVRQAVQVDQPPATTDAVTATNLGALGALGTQNFFSPTARHRVAVVLTDGESRPFDVRQTARALAHAPGVMPIFVQLGSQDEAVFDPGGRPESAYHPDATSNQTLASLAQAAGGKAFRESDLGAAARAVRAAIGSGPSRPQGLTVSTRSLAPYAALAALVPLFYLLAEAGLPSLAAARVPRRAPRPASTARRAPRSGASQVSARL